jgi:hypothetical protein
VYTRVDRHRKNKQLNRGFVSPGGAEEGVAESGRLSAAAAGSASGYALRGNGGKEGSTEYLIKNLHNLTHTTSGSAEYGNPGSTWVQVSAPIDAAAPALSASAGGGSPNCGHQKWTPLFGPRGSVSKV